MDAYGQLAEIESPAGSFRYEYHPTDPALLVKTSGPAHTVALSYEPHRDLVTEINNQSLTTRQVLSAYRYENDLLGRRTRIGQSGGALDPITLEVAYNDRSEVIGATYRDGEEQTSHRYRYAYDAIGNRTRSETELGSQISHTTYRANALINTKRSSPLQG